jgi:hypothetical protein
MNDQTLKETLQKLMKRKLIKTLVFKHIERIDINHFVIVGNDSSRCADIKNRVIAFFVVHKKFEPLRENKRFVRKTINISQYLLSWNTLCELLL